MSESADKWLREMAILYPDARPIQVLQAVLDALQDQQEKVGAESWTP